MLLFVSRCRIRGTSAISTNFLNSAPSISCGNLPESLFLRLVHIIAHRCEQSEITHSACWTQDLAAFPNSRVKARVENVFSFSWSSQFSIQIFDQAPQVRFAGVGVASCICDEVLCSSSAALGVRIVATRVSRVVGCYRRSKQSHRPPPRFPPASLAPQVF